MPRRPASVTQADIARAIRALKQEGVEVVRVVVRADGVSVETISAPSPAAGIIQQEIADDDEVVVL